MTSYHLYIPMHINGLCAERVSGDTDLRNDGDPGAQILQSKVRNIKVVNDDGACGWLNDAKQCQCE